MDLLDGGICVDTDRMVGRSMRGINYFSKNTLFADVGLQSGATMTATLHKETSWEDKYAALHIALCLDNFEMEGQRLPTRPFYAIERICVELQLLPSTHVTRHSLDVLRQDTTGDSMTLYCVSDIFIPEGVSVLLKRLQLDMVV